MTRQPEQLGAGETQQIELNRRIKPFNSLWDKEIPKNFQSPVFKIPDVCTVIFHFSSPPKAKGIDIGRLVRAEINLDPALDDQEKERLIRDLDFRLIGSVTRKEYLALLRIHGANKLEVDQFAEVTPHTLETKEEAQPFIINSLEIPELEAQLIDLKKLEDQLARY